MPSIPCRINPTTATTISNPSPGANDQYQPHLKMRTIIALIIVRAMNCNKNPSTGIIIPVPNTKARRILLFTIVPITKQTRILSIDVIIDFPPFFYNFI